MKKLYTARFVLSISGPPLEDAGLLTEGGRIIAVDRRSELETAAVDERHDFPAGILLPPLVNAHTHLELSDFPRWASELGEIGRPVDFVAWIEQVIRIKRRLAPDDFSTAIERGIDALLRAGTGAVGDIVSRISGPLPHRTSPLFGRLYGEVLGRGDEPSRDLWGAMAKLAAQRRCGRLQTGIAPHAPYSFAPEFFAEVLSRARDQGWPCTLHLAESPAESELLGSGDGPIAERLYPLLGWNPGLWPRGYRSPLAWLDAHGGLGPWNLLVHGVQLGREDADRLAATGNPLVLCPRSNTRLGVGSAPLELFLAAGVELALGTDSLASNASLSLWDELAFASANYGSLVTGTDLLRMATCNGAEALGLNGEMGRLQRGYGAHVQMVEAFPETTLANVCELLCRRGDEVRVAGLVLAGNDCLPNP